MAQGSFFGDGRYWLLLKWLAVMAAAKLSGLTADGAPLAALDAASALLLLWAAGVTARTAYASILNCLHCTTTIHGRTHIATAGDATLINTGKHSQSLNLCQAAPDRADFAWIDS